MDKNHSAHEAAVLLLAAARVALYQVMRDHPQDCDCAACWRGEALDFNLQVAQDLLEGDLSLHRRTARAAKLAIALEEAGLKRPAVTDPEPDPEPDEAATQNDSDPPLSLYAGR